MNRITNSKSNQGQEQDNCSLCDRPNDFDRARPDGCMDIFHRDCLVKWTENYRPENKIYWVTSFGIDPQAFCFNKTPCPSCKTIYNEIHLRPNWTKPRKREIDEPTRQTMWRPGVSKILEVRDPAYKGVMEKLLAKIPFTRNEPAFLNVQCSYLTSRQFLANCNSNCKVEIKTFNVSENTLALPTTVLSNESESDRGPKFSDNLPNPQLVPDIVNPSQEIIISNVFSMKRPKGIPAYLYCDICKKAFNSTSTKAKHNQRHKAINLSCTVCSKTLCSKPNLMRHYKEVHKIKSPRL